MKSLQAAVARVGADVRCLHVWVVLLVVDDLCLEHRRLDVQVGLGECHASEVGCYLPERSVDLVTRLGRHEEAFEVILLHKLLMLGRFDSAQVVQVGCRVDAEE